MVAEFLPEVWYGVYLGSCSMEVWGLKIFTSSFIIVSYKLVCYRVL